MEESRMVAKREKVFTPGTSYEKRHDLAKNPRSGCYVFCKLLRDYFAFLNVSVLTCGLGIISVLLNLQGSGENKFCSKIHERFAYVKEQHKYFITHNH